jgi:tRNA 2-thiocytidine biosynthesis protein TtcA
MIEDGDNILIGLSGGKDSMTLLYVLNERLKRIPIKYKLYPVYIDPGFDNSYADNLFRYCSDYGYNLVYEITDHGPSAHQEGNYKNPCFLCSRRRRQRLFEIADELGCTKLALGHNKDDIIETLFINMFYSGHISTMIPNRSMFQGRFRVIRPLSFVEEKEIIKFSNQINLPIFKNSCPSSNNSKRNEIKELLTKIYCLSPNIKGNIFNSMSQVREEYLLT